MASTWELAFAMLSIKQTNMDIILKDENIFDLQFLNATKLINPNVSDKEFKLF